MTRQSLNAWLWLGTAAIIYAAIYARTLGYGFIDDDFGFVKLDWAGALDSDLLARNFRPIWFLGYAAVSQLTDTSAFAHHLVNHVLHLANCALAFGLLRHWLGVERAAATVAIWTLLPQIAYPVVWIAQSSDPLMTLFLLAGLLLAERGARFAGFAGYVLAYLCKGTCLFLPLAYLTKWGLKKTRSDSVLAILLIISALPFAFVSVKTWGTNVHLVDLDIFLRLINFMKNYVYGWFNLIVPISFMGNIFIIFGYFVYIVSAIWIIRNHWRTTPDAIRCLIIATSLSLTLTVQPEIRGTYLQSLFLVAAFVAAIDWRKAWQSAWGRYILPAGAAGFLLYAIPAAGMTASRFESPVFDVTKPVVNGKDYSEDRIGGYYPVNFYGWFREVQIRLLRELSSKG